jgi:adenine-specific DNA-methyltransferase
MTMETDAADRLVLRTEGRRQAASKRLDSKKRIQLGQFFTPAPVAEFIASLPRLPPGGVLRVLDPGAGAGSLSAALIARIMREGLNLSVEVIACEIDGAVRETLVDTLSDCTSSAAAVGVHVKTILLDRDFIEWASPDDLFQDDPGLFDLVIMNPPYRKLNRATRERSLVETAAVDVSNLYTAFLALGVVLLAPDGQLVAITPRSFANGPYFRSFRRFFLARMDLDLMHIFKSRSTLFADAEVLQENVIFAATRRDTPNRGPVIISTSAGYHDAPQTREVTFDEVVHPKDTQYFMHISTDEQESELAAALAALPATLQELGMQVSTGRVVDFRVTEHLRQDPEPGAVPLIYPLHMRDGRFCWPVPGAKKCNAIVLNEDTKRQTFPAGHYVVVKRLSSKEERRRVVASVFDPDEVPCAAIGFENHVNVFHEDGHGITPQIAQGLCLWLNSTLLDRFIRRFNGHTQINATDLRNLRYPSKKELGDLGAAWGGGEWPDQDKIDNLVEEHVGASTAKLGVRD